MAGEISDEKKAALIAETRDMAAAGSEDIQYLRAMAGRLKPTAAEVRRASTILRRLLIDQGGDLRKIAPPRIGRLYLLGPDTSPWVRSIAHQPITLFSAGTALVGEVQVSSAAVDEGGSSRDLSDFDPDREILLSLDGFLNQGAVNFAGRWISRRDVIKYIANVANGVHSGLAKDPVDRLLERARHAVYLTLNGEMPELIFNADAYAKPNSDIKRDREGLDIALLQLISAVQYLVRSPDIIHLESVIATEIDQHRPAWRKR